MIALRTDCGTCVPPGPSKKIRGFLFSRGASAGNCSRVFVMFNLCGEDKDIADSWVCRIFRESVCSVMEKFLVV